MKDFAGKTAFVTGGAGGIGFAMARAFGRRGMKVAIADVEADTCAKAVETLACRRHHGDRNDLRCLRPRSICRSRRAHFRRIRQGARPLQQCRGLARRPDRDHRVVGLGLGDRRQSEGSRPRPAAVPAADEGAWRGRPHRQHGLGQRRGRLGARRSLQRDQVRGGRHLRGAGGGTEGHADRRQRALPELGQDPHARQWPQPPGALWRSDQDRDRQRQCRAQCALCQGAGDRARSG